MYLFAYDIDNALERRNFILIFPEIQTFDQGLARIIFTWSCIQAQINQRNQELRLGEID